MNKALKYTLAAFAAVFLMTASALAWSVDGEIGVKVTGYDSNTDGIYRLGEFNALPKDGSLSVLRLHNMKADNYLRLDITGFNLGEDDAEASVYAGLGRHISAELEFDRIHHRLAPGLFTERDSGALTLNVGLLSRLSGTFTYSSEDKVGLEDTLLPIGHKNEEAGVSVKAVLGDLVGEVALAAQEMQDNEASYDNDKLSVYGQYAPAANTFDSISYSVNDYSPSRLNNAGDSEVTNFTFTDYRTFRKGISLSSVYSVRERETDTAGSLSLEDNMFSTKLGLSCGYGKVSLLYKNVERDYVGGNISSSELNLLQVKGSSKLSFLGLKGSYDHGYRDISGVSNDYLINQNQRGAEFTNVNLSVNLLGFKNFGLTLYSKRDSNKYTIYNLLGTTSSLSSITGISSYYVPDANFLMTLNLYQAEHRMEGAQQFYYGAATYRFEDLAIADSSDFLQLGFNYAATKSTTLLLDFTLVRSDLVDSQDNNTVDETIVSLKAEHDLSKTYSLNVGVTLNDYSDLLDSATSGSNTRLEVELIKSF